MLDLYVYYKVREADGAQLAPRILAIQQQLGAQHGVSASLKRRPQASNGCQTWMEVYPAVADNFAALLEQAVIEAGVAPLIEGARHIEVFMDLSPCA